MQTNIFFIFEPTAILVELAAAANQSYMAQRSVWVVVDHDKVGPEHTQDDLIAAHWCHFRAHLIGEDDEREDLRAFREKCERLGFSGCWTIYETRVGGPAGDLIDEGQAAKDFLAGRESQSG